MQNYYELLAVPNNAVKSEIKRAYRKLALLWHPDKNQNPEANQRFREICEAYQILFDDRRRRIYDRERYRRAFNNNNYNSNSSSNSQSSHNSSNNNINNNNNNNGSSSATKQQSNGYNSFSRFSFKSPHEIFKEEFGDESPKYYETVDPPASYCSCYHSPNDVPHRNFMAFMRDPFTNMSMNMDEPVEVKQAQEGAGEPRDIVVTTKYVGGQKIVTKKYQDNHGETILLYENGKLISKTFNCWSHSS